MQISKVQGPGRCGLNVDTITCRVFNRTGTTVALGDLVMFDFSDSDADNPPFSLVIGNDGSILANVIVPATNGIGGLSGATIKGWYWFGVVTNLDPEKANATTPGADNTVIEIAVQGVVNAACVATAITTGVTLCAANGVKTLTPTFAAGNKALAMAWQPNGSAAGVYQVIFDGVNCAFGGPAAS